MADADEIRREIFLKTSIAKRQLENATASLHASICDTEESLKRAKRNIEQVLEIIDEDFLTLAGFYR